MEGSKDLLVLDTKGNPLGSKDLLVLDTKDFMEGSKDLLVLDTKDLGTLSWREVRIF